MTKEIIKEELKWLLEAINEQYEGICRQGERIPQIEFDILMENLRKFYEDMHILKRLDDPHFSYEKKSRPREAEKIVSPVKSVPNPLPETRAYAPAQQQPQPQPRPLQSNPAVKVTVHQESQPALKRQLRPEEIDLFASAEPALNMRLQEARDRTFSPKIPSGRIENLKTAIIINDKFMFINELFDGNLREYNETIETLNGFKTLDQAADYLDLMRKKNFWNTGSVAFKKLKELVELRF